ncbi:hypothetical protein EMIT0158MI4_50055 [Burkholderia ambifaria]
MDQVVACDRVQCIAPREHAGRHGRNRFLHIDRGHPFAYPVDLHEELRHARHAVGMHRQRERRAERRAFDDRLRRRVAVRDEHVLQQPADAFRRRVEHPLRILKLRERRAVTQRIARAGHQDQRRFDERPEREFGRQPRRIDDRDHEVERAVAQARQRRVEKAFAHVEADRRHPLAKRVERGGQKAERHQRRQRARERAFLAARQMDHVVARVLHLREDQPRACIDGLAEARELRAARVARDERHAEVLLEFADRLRECGLGQMDRTRGGAQAPVFGDGGKRPELMVFHGVAGRGGSSDVRILHRDRAGKARDNQALSRSKNVAPGCVF